MKKIFVFILLSISVTNQAQEVIKGAFGVEFGESMTSVQELMSDYKPEIDKVAHGFNLGCSNVLVGWQTYDYMIFRFNSNRELFEIVALIKIDINGGYESSDAEAMRVYNKIKILLQDKYGNPVHLENPDYPYKKGYGMWGKALSDKKAYYGDYWLGAPDWKDKITIELQIIAGWHSINLTYTNDKLFQKAVESINENSKSLY
jgi:hypothetical protein